MRRIALIAGIALAACAAVALAAVHAGTYRGTSNRAEGPTGKVTVTLTVSSGQRVSIKTGGFFMPCRNGHQIVDEINLHGTRSLQISPRATFSDTFTQEANLKTTGRATGTIRIRGHFSGRIASGTITSTLNGTRTRCATQFGFRASRS